MIDRVIVEDLRVAGEEEARLEFPPGTRAPSCGIYEQRNVLGTPTGVRIIVARGDVLPAAPRGFTWSIVEVHAE